VAATFPSEEGEDVAATISERRREEGHNLKKILTICKMSVRKGDSETFLKKRASGDNAWRCQGFPTVRAPTGGAELGKVSDGAEWVSVGENQRLAMGGKSQITTRIGEIVAKRKEKLVRESKSVRGDGARIIKRREPVGTPMKVPRRSAA